jgi:hypothetical protein
MPDTASRRPSGDHEIVLSASAPGTLKCRSSSPLSTSVMRTALSPSEKTTCAMRSPSGDHAAAE